VRHMVYRVAFLTNLIEMLGIVQERRPACNLATWPVRDNRPAGPLPG
jgi:hypothetical protein